VKKLIEFLITSIIDQPEKFSLEESTTEAGFTNYIISVAPEDMGKVIGKKGKIIKALRTIIRTKGLKENKRAILSLQE